MKKLLVASLLLSLPAFPQTQPDQPPAWAKEVVWYQIFVERFYNGDPKNDPTAEDISIPAIHEMAPAGWSVTPWTGDWFGQQPWESKMGKSMSSIMQYRRYGGDLQGVMNKLDYLQELGVTALFMNPLNYAPSLHKYDPSHYHHIDVNFGPDPAGDKKIIASEKPNEPSTWRWTRADKLFLQLVQELHRRKMKIIMDFSWNHTGTTFWAWQDILKTQEASPYRDWYAIKSFDNPATPENEFAYAGWAGVPSLPEIKKSDITTVRKNGHPYEGNINPGAKKHIFAVTQRWLAPDGNPANGIDGFRLDVADQIGLGFWREFRSLVRSIQPNAYLVGEIWWEQWPRDLMNPAPYTRGDVFDAVMFYHVYRPARAFFAKVKDPLDAKQFKDSLEFQWSRIRPETRLAMMNVSSSHDTPRLLTDFYNPNPYKFKSTPSDDPAFLTGKPDEETYRRLKLYLLWSFTSVGAPNIWNGEEMGMWGADDPFNRKPLMWKEFAFSPETRNNFQPGETQHDPVAFHQNMFDWYRLLAGIRNKSAALRSGKLEFLLAEGKKLGYNRSLGQEEYFIYFNLDNVPLSIQLPAASGYVNLLTGKSLSGRLLNLGPLEGSLLMVKKEK